MILIVGAYVDPHITSVTNHLEELQAEYIILDRFDYKNSSSYSIKFAENAVLHLGAGQHSSHITSVWWRQKPPFIVPNESVSEYYDSIFSNQEWNHVHKYLEYKLSGIFSINDPITTLPVHNKLYQLEIANSLGFKTPRTIFTNNPNKVIDFIEEVEPCKTIFKTLTAYMNPTGNLTYTTVVDKSMVKAKNDSITIAPGIYQEYINKKFELRITIVGSDVFAVKILAPVESSSVIDWRSSISKDIYEDYQLTEALQSQILELHLRFGLVYGAYDFIIDDQDNLVFLEVNPSGQWLWLERRLNHPISKKIAQILLDKSW